MSQYGIGLYSVGTDHPYASVAGKVMWMVQVDWNRDGLFGSEIEPQTLTKIKTRGGRTSRIRTDGTGQESTKLETFWIEVIDSARRYDGYNVGSPLYAYIGAVGMAVRILEVSTTVRGPAETVFTGTLTAINYNSRTGRATLTGEGMARWLMDKPVSTPCQIINGGHDSYFHDDGSTPFPVNYWKGRPNGVTLRECTALTLARAGYPFGGYYGESVVNNEQPDYFYFDGSSAWAHLEELADGFAARMFILRDGRVFAMDRNDVTGLNVGAVAPTRAQVAFGIERPNAYTNLRNTVKVNVRAHAVIPFKSPYIDAYYKEVWSQSGPFAVAPRETIELDVKYEGDAPSEGSLVSTNTTGYAVTMECWSAADRSGTRMDSSGSGDGEFAVEWDPLPGGAQRPFGNDQQGTRVKFRNFSAVNTAYFFDAKLMLIGIRETGTGVKQAVDAASVALNGVRTLTINSRWVQTAGMGTAIAQAYADALSSREKASPATLLYQWSGETLYQNLLTYDLGAFVNFGVAGGSASLDNFGIWGRWLIVGREIEWMSPDGQDAWVKLTYEYIGPPSTLVLERSGSYYTALPGATITWAYQVDNQVNRLLLVGVSVRAYQSVSTVTYNGIALARYSSVQYLVDNNPRVELWYMVAPAVGTHNIIVTLTDADFAQAIATNFYNAHQGLPLGPAVTASWVAGVTSQTVLGAVGDIVIDYLGLSGADTAPGAGQTLLGRDSCDGNWKIQSSSKPGGASVDMAWGFTVEAWAHVAVAVRPAA